MVSSKLVWTGLQKIQPLVLVFFILLSIVLGVVCLILGTKNMMLQSQLLVDKKQDIKVIVDTQKIADVISKTYSKERVEREVIYEKIKGDTEVITKQDIVFHNVCVSDDGMRHYNDFVSSPLTSEPE